MLCNKNTKKSKVSLTNWPSCCGSVVTCHCPVPTNGMLISRSDVSQNVPVQLGITLFYAAPQRHFEMQRCFNQFVRVSTPPISQASSLRKFRQDQKFQRAQKWIQKLQYTVQGVTQGLSTNLGLRFIGLNTNFNVNTLKNICIYLTLPSRKC